LIPITNVEEAVTFCVGQQISFNLAATQSLPTSFTNNVLCNWTLPDSANFVNGSTTNSAGCPNYTNNPSLLVTTNSPCSCWYINGTGGKVSVGVSMIMPNGKSIALAAVGRFGIYRPSIADFSTDPPAIITNAAGFLELGTGNVGGMSFEVDVSSTYPGCADYTQLIKRNANSGVSTTTTSGQYWLDNSRFYLSQTSDSTQVRTTLTNDDTPLVFNDNPAIGLSYFYPVYTTSISDNFIDYVVFRPGPQTATGNIFVTLGKTSWSWSAITTWSNGAWSTPTGGVMWPTAPDNSDDFPIWSQIIHNTSN
jgi:hypothetical protein